jgi:hypothetical protein
MNEGRKEGRKSSLEELTYEKAYIYMEGSFYN